MNNFKKDKQYFKFSAYGFLKNLRFFDAFLLLFFLENNISYSEIGILYAIREIIINVFEIPSGILSDTYGRKNALVFSFLCYIASFVAFYYSTNFNLLLIAMILFGIAEAFRSGTHKGMIMDYLKLNNWSDHKIAYYGHTRSWSQKGSAIAALIAGVLVLYSGNYRMVFLVAVIPYLLNFANVITYPDNLNYSATAKKKQVKSVKRVLKNFTDAIKNRNVFRIMNSSALYSAFLKAIKDYIQLVMVQIAILVPILQAVDVKRKNGLIIGILYSFIFILTSIASKNAAKFYQLKSKNSSRLTLIYGLLAGILCGVLFNFQQWILALVAFVIIYIIENIRKPILTGILSNHVPNEILTSVISAQSLYKTIITAVLAVLFGFLSDKFGIGISLIAISAMLLLFVLLINLSSRKN